MEITRPAAVRQTPSGLENLTAVMDPTGQDKDLKVTKKEGEFADNLALQQGAEIKSPVGSSTRTKTRTRRTTIWLWQWQQVSWTLRIG